MDARAGSVELRLSQAPLSNVSAPRKIKSIRFSLMSNQEIQRVAEFHVFERNLYQMPARSPLANGILDTRLGTTDKKGECQTCKGKLNDCGGHFGYIKLELPVFHVGYFKNIIAVLQCVCKSCARVMVPEEERRTYLRKLRNPHTEVHARRIQSKKLLERCKRFKTCPFCAQTQGVVKRAGSSLKIVHEKYSKSQAMIDAFTLEFGEAMKHNDALRSNLPKVQEDLNPIRVLSLFERISKEDCDLLDIHDRPESLVVTHLAVPPVCIRPSVEMESAGSNEDDLTMKLMQIIEVNNVLRQGLEKGLAITNLMENWDFLQLQCALYINSELPGIPQAFQTPGKPLRGFVQRLKGKQGRFRGNLSGKRVDFSGRTVISPDPNLRVDEVGVPQDMAKTLTYPEQVFKHNIERLRKCVRNGMGTLPGANFVVFKAGGKQYLKYGDRKRVAAELKYGDVVERHLQNGDVVLFNRQPSLHKMSIMAHRARIMPWRTMRFNECVCTPYNADFDGDEMNIHVPQTEEARAEAIMLMGVQSNLCTPKNGEILIAATQDFLTAAYLLTSKDRFFDRAQFALLCSFMGDALDAVELPTPTILRPVELWTGKQLFSVLVRPNSRTCVFVNLELEEKAYTRTGRQMCANDGFVCFRNSELLSGRLGKVTLGSGNKAGLFYALSCDYAPEVAAQTMNRLAKLSARWLGTRGFSIGIADVTPDGRLMVEKERQVQQGYADCDRLIAQFADGQLQLLPGCTAEQTLENSILGVLSRVRDQAGNVCLEQLPRHNSPLIMALCGSKGSTINICQMVACVGQQAVGGSRIQDGFLERTLPHFHRGERTPNAKGFVGNSFYTGLSPTEFFFHTMGGREGLVDTAVKTAETGYMSRRLMKALEDLSTRYDNTVRNSMGGIVQLVYGDDGLDPVSMEGKDGTPVDFRRLFMRVCAAYPRLATPGTEVAPDALAVLSLAVAQNAYVTAGDGTAVNSFFRASLLAFAEEELARVRGYPSEALVLQQLRHFVEHAIERYMRKKTEPGTAVGAIGAQSIGEPGTQMTLKTFHFAGVASMNVTLGVPRIKEIINAAKAISTPIITCVLLCDDSLRTARLVKGRLEKTMLGQVVEEISQRLDPGQCYVRVKLNARSIAALQLSIDASTVATAILNTTKLKLKPHNVNVMGPDVIHVLPPEAERLRAVFALQTLSTSLQKVIVQGIPSVERAVINDLGGGRFNLLVEGTNLQAVMGTEGVKALETKTNHVMETERTLGIEAARLSIITEINATMQAHGMSIDMRHSKLLADVMTYKGEVLGITRFGMAKMKDSVLMLASFEKTTDHLFDAAIHGRTDDIVGVSESIIMGAECPLGTGLFKLFMQGEAPSLPRRPALILESRIPPIL